MVASAEVKTVDREKYVEQLLELFRRLSQKFFFSQIVI